MNKVVKMLALAIVWADKLVRLQWWALAVQWAGRRKKLP